MTRRERETQRETRRDSLAGPEYLYTENHARGCATGAHRGLIELGLTRIRSGARARVRELERRETESESRVGPAETVPWRLGFATVGLAGGVPASESEGRGPMPAAPAGALSSNCR